MDTDMLSEDVNNLLYVDAEDPHRKNEEPEVADSFQKS